MRFHGYYTSIQCALNISRSFFSDNSRETPHIAPVKARRSWVQIWPFLKFYHCKILLCCVNYRITAIHRQSIVYTPDCTNMDSVMMVPCLRNVPDHSKYRTTIQKAEWVVCTSITLVALSRAIRYSYMRWCEAGSTLHISDHSATRHKTVTLKYWIKTAWRAHKIWSLCVEMMEQLCKCIFMVSLCFDHWQVLFTFANPFGWQVGVASKPISHGHDFKFTIFADHDTRLVNLAAMRLCGVRASHGGVCYMHIMFQKLNLAFSGNLSPFKERDELHQSFTSYPYMHGPRHVAPT